MRKPIHIMHVLGDLGVGGAEMGVVRLINSLGDESMRHSITIVGSDQTLLSATGANVTCHALGIQGHSYLAFVRMAQLFKSQQVDVVHVNNLSLWPDAALGALLSGCRCVETFHGIESSKLCFSTTKQIIFRATARLTTRITAVAEEAAQLMAALTGIDRSAVELIPNGVDTSGFAPPESADEKRRLRKLKCLPETGILLGCVAALRPVKNHRGLLHSFAQAIRSSNIMLHLVLVGDGPLKGDLMAQTKELRIQENVSFFGQRRDVDELLRCFDVFVLNSDTEGLSYALLEAMASGLPVIATAVGANPSLIDSGNHGWLCARSDIPALTSILKQIPNDPKALEIMGRAARKYVQQEYSLSRMTDAYARLYQATLGRIQ